MFATTKIKSLISFFAVVSALWRPAVIPPPPIVTALCYHTFDDGRKNPHRSSYSVSAARFAEEMRYLSVQKIPVIPLSALTDHFYSKTPLPERAVIITIDDGYKTAKAIAWPILQTYHYPFTVFVYPHAIGHLRAAMTWDDLRDLARSGVDIQSHSLTHPLLTHPGKTMNKPDYRAWIDYELSESKQRIEEELGMAVTSIAYPYGGYDLNIVDRARAAGYKTALTCDDGDVSSFSDPMLLNRRLVFRKTSLKTFAAYFRFKPLRLSDLSPRDGERVKDLPAEIVVRVADVDQILPETAQILVDKVGRHWRPVAVDPITGILRYPVPTSARHGYFFVSLVAQDRANPALRREASWLFIVSRNASKK